MEQEPQEGLLQGVRVLDLTRVLAGPFASMILADFGAEVIKIELPGGGDEARGFGPFVNGESAYFASVNRGKKSVAVDLRRERGQELARAVAGSCDLLLENFRPGSMARFGLDFDSLHAAYPRLVYASISGFGQTGPYARRPAYDVIIQAMSGIASITGVEGQPPVRVGSSIADLGAALYGVIGMVAALARARETGRGQHLDVSMLDCQIALLENAVARYDVTGEVPAPLGSRHPAITPFQFFRAAGRVPRDRRRQQPPVAVAVRDHRFAGAVRGRALRDQRAAHPQPRRDGKTARSPAVKAFGGGMVRSFRPGGSAVRTDQRHRGTGLRSSRRRTQAP